MNDQYSYLAENRIVEEVPGIEDDMKFYVWDGSLRKAVFHARTKQEAQDWCDANGLHDVKFEPFEP